MSASTAICRASQRLVGKCTPALTQVRAAALQKVVIAPKQDQQTVRSFGATRMVSRRVNVAAMATGSDAGLKIDLRGTWRRWTMGLLFVSMHVSLSYLCTMCL